MLVHKSYESHTSLLTEFEPVDNDFIEFVSYKVKFTSGLELMAEQINWYVRLVVKSFTKFMVWVELTI